MVRGAKTRVRSLLCRNLGTCEDALNLKFSELSVVSGLSRRIGSNLPTTLTGAQVLNLMQFSPGLEDLIFPPAYQDFKW